MLFPIKIPGKFRGTKLAARIGYKTLIETGNVLDAVEQAVRSMELDDDFNAGYGSVLTRLFVAILSNAVRHSNLFVETLKWRWTRA